MEDEDKRLRAILGKNTACTVANMKRYRAHLLEQLVLPVLVTGSEDFPWEEPYVLGMWDEAEYAELKKTRPSYSDTFELQALAPVSGQDDVTAQVQRVSDGKTFEIGLSWLTVKDEGSSAHALLADYGYWHTNY